LLSATLLERRVNNCIDRPHDDTHRLPFRFEPRRQFRVPCQNRVTEVFADILHGVVQHSLDLGGELPADCVPMMRQHTCGR
jgi:hypothetical protein